MQRSPRTRRTKIVCTIGPATAAREQIEQLVQAGMDVARLNFSHGERAWHARRIEILREVAGAWDRPIGVMLDVPGPKLRIGEVGAGTIRLERGQQLRLVTEPVPGDGERVSVNYDALPEELCAGDRVFLADGVIELEVIATRPGEVVTRVLAGGPLSSGKGLNFPTRTLGVPSLSERDREALDLAVEAGVDFVALSFVRAGADVELAKQVMLEAGGSLPVIAKIEKHEALDNLDEILAAADGVLVARGDLAVEIPLEEVPQVQKRIIRAANDAGKPVITATQMLRSMVSEPRPTRAEITDVANALYDGTDAVMLSEETALGEHPALTVEIMHRICVATERDMLQQGRPRPLPPHRRGSVPDVVAAAAAHVADNLDAAALLVPTRTGSTAMKMAEFRPRQPILAISTHPATVGRLTISWGVAPLLGHEVPSHEAMLDEAERVALEAELVAEGDLVVITAGFPVGGPGSTNTVTVKQVGQRLAARTGGCGEPSTESDA